MVRVMSAYHLGVPKRQRSRFLDQGKRYICTGGLSCRVHVNPPTIQLGTFGRKIKKSDCELFSILIFMSAHPLCIGEIFTDRRNGFSLLRSVCPLIPIATKRTFLSCKSVIVHKSFIYGFRYSVFKVLLLTVSLLSLGRFLAFLIRELSITV